MKKIAVVWAMLGLCAGISAATFEVDPSRSSLTLSGTVAGVEVREQGAGSLTGRIGGAMEVSISAEEIEFVGGALDAETNGVWRPGINGEDGAVPADFGAQGSSFLGTVYGALREIVINIEPSRIPLNGAGFDGSGIVFSFPTDSSAALDYDAGLLGTDRKNLAGNATNAPGTVGTITVENGARTVTLTIDATFIEGVLVDGDTELTVRGQIVAVEGQAAGPVLVIERVGNEIRIVADEVDATYELESSVDLAAWSEREATVEIVDADTRRYTVTLSGNFEWFRLVQTTAP